MDPLIACIFGVFGTPLQTKTKASMESAKLAMASLELITTIPKEVKAAMTKDQVKEWAVFVYQVEIEWMETVESVTKL